ncbi:uncharacterized protein PV06_09187 [Exophiala oligosperma]|uniref:lytic cellulose monooxygenase (C4-dehydrogenating) n=1 Tax=Exophiala oligosperma TaxID=215243 RepID=A0A0D2AH45_9EURO|nr:uncharacterized protein PV06_09187 [Exophiala oligosperma]KIW39416.1 hypothetical protein PV06_09187 [Exophiala oligosperma]
MSLVKSTALVGVLGLVSRVSAHGIVSGIVAGGKWYSGYNPSFQYQNPPPVVAGWSIPEDNDYGFVSDYTSPDIICHKGATPGGVYVSVAAGESLELQWSEWPESHRGPMIDYLASCGDGDCTSVDKTQLKFNKIDEAGLVDGSNPPGTWASDDMIANNNSWVVTVPSTIAPGKYVLRHETIALHSAFDVGGAQNYPQCINLEITGSGSTSLTGGTVGTELYDAQDPGILINIYEAPIKSYVVPGPPLFDGSSSPGGGGGSGSQQKPSGSLSVSSSATANGSSFAPAASSTGFAITNFPSRPVAIVTSTSSAAPVEPTETGAEECPAETAPVAILPVTSFTSNVAAAITLAPESSTTPVATGTSPASFTSTVIGRTGQTTKFVCHVVD